MTLEQLHRGAEADLYLLVIGPWKVVVKQRIRKTYRDSNLDQEIRRERTVSEASHLHQAKLAGARAPSLLGIDIEKNSILMTYIGGGLVRDRLEKMSPPERIDLFSGLGEQIGRLHDAGIVHGDLTTSNLVMADRTAPFILDFGMSFNSKEPEDRGVDIHLLQRSLVTTNPSLAQSYMKQLSKGYETTAGTQMARSTFGKAIEISRRGRYYAIR